MTSMNYCRLCVNIGLDFKSLYDEDGQGNEVYDLTTKYFDPLVLNIDEAKHLTVICLQCWEHIWDFNNFQQAVHVAQSNLDAVRQMDISTPIQNAEKKVTNETVQELEQINSSTTDKNDDCICLSESEEIEAPTVTQTALNNLQSEEKNDEHLTEVDLTLDEDVAPPNVDADELVDDDDPVEGFVGGEFTNENEITPQPDLELIDIDSDSNFSIDEYASINSTETLSACETDINNVEQDSYNNLNNTSAVVTYSGDNLTQEIDNQELNKFLDQSMQSLKCAICLEACYRFYILREHFDQKHPSTNIQTVCCNNKHTGLEGIAAHLLSHKGPLNLSCELCGKNYVRLHYLKRHILEHHPGVGKQLLDIRAELLNEDYEKKLQQRSRHNYPCSECGKNATTFFSLRRHIWVHHQAKHKFKCEICERTFKNAIDLREHTTSHTGEHLYTCPYCQQKFKLRARFYEHQKKIHGDQPVQGYSKV